MSIAGAMSELVVAHRPFAELVRASVSRADVALVGSILENRRHHRREFILHRPAVTFETQGMDRARRGARDWALIGVGVDERLDRWRRELAQSQGLGVAALVGLGTERTGWQGFVIDRGRQHELDALRIVAPGAPMGQRLPRELEIEPFDAERFSRQLPILGESAQGAIRGARFGLVGVGRLGSTIASLLADHGAGGVILADSDRIEPANLDMALIEKDDEGRYKVEALAERLLLRRPEMTVCWVPKRAHHPRSIAALRTADLLISCSDSGAGRLMASGLSSWLCRPHIDVGTGIQIQPNGERVLAGDVRFFLPCEGCIRCVGGVPDLELAEYELEGPPEALRPGPPVDWRDQRAGSLPTMNALAAAFAVQTILDYFTGRLTGSRWHRLRWVEAVGLETNSAAVQAAWDCRFCRPEIRQ